MQADLSCFTSDELRHAIERNIQRVISKFPPSPEHDRPASEINAIISEIRHCNAHLWHELNGRGNV